MGDCAISFGHVCISCVVSNAATATIIDHRGYNSYLWGLWSGRPVFYTLRGADWDAASLGESVLRRMRLEPRLRYTYLAGRGAA